MIWLTWRQHRKQALFTAIALAVLAALMVPTGLKMHDVYDSSGLGACLAKLGDEPVVRGGGCRALKEQFDNRFAGFQFVAILFAILPLLVGLFFGAPLVSREVENGTHRLVWTQGVSRRHWARVKFALVGGAATLVAVVYALGVTWWYEPLAASGNGRFIYVVFDVQGIAPIGYTLFAVALGIFAGTVCRKVMPAMGVTVAGFVVVRIAVEVLARSHFRTAKTLSYGVQGDLNPNPGSGAWVQHQYVRNAAGDVVMNSSGVGCPDSGTDKAKGSGDAATQCLDELARSGVGRGSYNWIEYQPADRFWLFQSIETGIFVALAAVLVYLAVRRIRSIA